MTLTDLIYIIDKEMTIKFVEVGNQEVEYFIDTLPLNWLSRTVAFITRENDDNLDEEPLVVYTFNNEGFIDIYMPDGREGVLWTDGSTPVVELFENNFGFEN